jgi:hypothetical protein
LPYRHRKLPGYKTRESQSANFATVPRGERKIFLSFMLLCPLLRRRARGAGISLPTVTILYRSFLDDSARRADKFRCDIFGASPFKASRDEARPATRLVGTRGTER